MKSKLIKNTKYHILEIALLIIMVMEFYPIFIIFSSSFKSRKELAVNPFGFPHGFMMSNIANAFIQMRLYKSIINSLIISSLSIILIIIIASMAAYPISRRKNKIFGLLYMFFLAGIMIPYQLGMLPLYEIGVSLRLINKYHGIIMIYAALFISLPIFIYVGFIKSVPIELEEAAIIDGCGKYKTFWSIVFPLLKPATATVAVLNIINIWNDFILALLFMQNPSMQTITVSLFTFRGQYHVNWPQMFAGVLLAISPMIIFFFSMQKYFIKGITSGAVKG